MWAMEETEFGGNLVHVILGLGLWLGGCTTILHLGECVTWQLFNGNSFVTSAALAEICTLLRCVSSYT